MGVNGVDWCIEGVSGPYGVKSLEIHKTGMIDFFSVYTIRRRQWYYSKILA